MTYMHQGPNTQVGQVLVTVKLLSEAGSLQSRFLAAVLCDVITNFLNSSWRDMVQERHFREAFSALSEAVKYKRDSWQTWSNYAHAAVQTHNYLQAARGILQVTASTCMSAPGHMCIPARGVGFGVCGLNGAAIGLQVHSPPCMGSPGHICLLSRWGSNT